MNYKINDYERIVEKASKITGTKYETDYWDCPVLLMALEDMIRAFKILENEYKEYQKEVEDNFKQIDVAEQYDINDRDFI